jgi:hypothetical protein
VGYDHRHRPAHWPWLRGATRTILSPSCRSPPGSSPRWSGRSFARWPWRERSVWPRRQSPRHRTYDTDVADAAAFVKRSFGWAVKHDLSAGEVRDGSIRTAVRLASPRSRAGRIVADAALLDRYANYLNRLSYLGGDSRLRGYPSQYLVGSRLLTANVEYRSRAWQLLESVQLGGVLSYDTGDAFDRWKDLDFRQAAGFGARVLFPQLDRIVFRADVGFPLARQLPQGVPPVNFFVTFGQAFSP